MKEIIVANKDSGQRFDKLLIKYLKGAPSSFVYKMLRKKNIVLNDKKATGKELLCEGDNIKLYFSDETLDKFTKGDTADNNLELSKSIPTPVIVYEDENMIIADKPAGILSQKSDRNDISMNEICLNYMFEHNMITEEELSVFKPSVVNRLDRNTSGLIIFAKNYKTASIISEALKNRTIHKYYYCIVSGVVEKASKINGYLIKNEENNTVSITTERIDDSAYIETAITPVLSNGKASLLEIELITGKTHQIRAHLASVSHPIIGDYKYGNRRLNDKYKQKYGLDYQLLFSHKVIFPEFDDEDYSYLSGKIITAKMPKIFKEIIDVDLEKQRT